MYTSNVAGTQVRVAPTLVSYKESPAVGNKEPGMAQHTKVGEWRETLPVEREQARRFPKDYAQAARVT